MPLKRVSPKELVMAFLRKNLVDHRVGRTGEWIFPDKPSVEDVNFGQFPLVSVESSISTTGEMGMDFTEVFESAHIIINVWTKRREPLTIDTFTETFSKNGNYTLLNVPVNKIQKITNTDTSTELSSTEYSLIDVDNDGFYDTIYFSSLPEATNLEVVTERIAEGAELAEYIAQEIHELLRNNWRSAFAGKLWDYRRVDLGPPPFVDDYRMYRCELEVRFNGVNIGD